MTFFWFIVFGISIIGVFSIILFRLFKPQTLSVESEEEMKRRLEEGINALKDKSHNILKSSGNFARRRLSSAYEKGLSRMQETQVGNLVKGRGILKKKDITSSFLKDVKNHKDKIREELSSGSIEKEV